MIPDYESIMLPLLKFAGDKQEHHIREAIAKLASQFNISDDEKKELLPSGQQAIFDNRVGWARTYLKKAGLLETPRRGFLKITERGLKVIENSPNEINVEFLSQFPEFITFRTLRYTKPDAVGVEAGLISAHLPDEKRTPEEYIGIGYDLLLKDLVYDLLERIKQCSPDFFEKLVVELLVKMGYGGSIQDAGKAIGRSGDEGIDGIIKEDKLGLDIIYIQAKKWESSVSRPEIQKFAGALQGQRARKGIFITTSSFSKDAVEYVSKIDNKIILIDGEQLSKLMIEHSVGVSRISSFDIKKIDSDYFLEE